jgi:hypothetical protein
MLNTMRSTVLRPDWLPRHYVLQCSHLPRANAPVRQCLAGRYPDRVVLRTSMQYSMLAYAGNVSGHHGKHWPIAGCGSAPRPTMWFSASAVAGVDAAIFCSGRLWCV